jgi:hypothetical protein
MVRWLMDRPDTPRRLRESGRPVPGTASLQVFDRPVPPYRGAIQSQAELIRAWRALHDRPAAPRDVAGLLGLSLPAKDDLLVRSQTPRHAFRGQRQGFSAINYGRFSEDSSLQCRFVAPETGRPTYLVVRPWPEAGAWQQFAEQPPDAVRRLIAEGCGILSPLLFGQARAPGIDEYRQAIEDSYLFTTYNRTPAAHQAGDIVTTARLAELELGVAPSSLTVVADRGAGLVALAAWAFLSSRTEIGPFAGDMGDADLADPETWAGQAYFPLLAAAGGTRALAGLAAGKRAFLTGVPASCRRLLPRSFRVAEPGADLDGLLGLLARG